MGVAKSGPASSQRVYRWGSQFFLERCPRWCQGCTMSLAPLVSATGSQVPCWTAQRGRFDSVERRMCEGQMMLAACRLFLRRYQNQIAIEIPLNKIYECCGWMTVCGMGMKIWIDERIARICKDLRLCIQERKEGIRQRNIPAHPWTHTEPIDKAMLPYHSQCHCFWRWTPRSLELQWLIRVVCVVDSKCARGWNYGVKYW